MFLVVVARPPRSLDAAIAALVRLQNLSLYEARARLTGDPPRIVAILGSADDAHALNQSLLAEGFVSLIVSGQDIFYDQHRHLVASLSFEPDALVATLRNGQTRRVAHDDISLLLRGLRAATQTTTREETSTQFSPGKALLTGGLMMTSKKTTTTTTTNVVRQGFFYIHDRSGEPPLALYEQRTNYGFLGSALQPSSAANFMTVVNMVRQRAPRARYDERLLRGANLGAMPLSPHANDPEGWKVDVAAAVLAASADALG